MFPFDFGFIPFTLGDDGDPLDILVLNVPRRTLGCLMDVRIIGIIKAKQTEDGETVENDRCSAWRFTLTPIRTFHRSMT